MSFFLCVCVYDLAMISVHLREQIISSRLMDWICGEIFSFVGECYAK